MANKEEPSYVPGESSLDLFPVGIDWEIGTWHWAYSTNVAVCYLHHTGWRVIPHIAKSPKLNLSAHAASKVKYLNTNLF